MDIICDAVNLDGVITGLAATSGAVVALGRHGAWRRSECRASARGGSASTAEGSGTMMDSACDSDDDFLPFSVPNLAMVAAEVEAQQAKATQRGSAADGEVDGSRW
eukprot:CAMPEP_0117678424 /NCGR_PEP_ID=MMETSP0804-20121206/17290_1 /TAXON_ID=1074897 /ORGANISM="Tetraselmis astigmatica, Strain CCMP880" /LENGTH=105 /DNA_ID=CAMNT_0005487811 /DNA_START=1111 /DNA_END=1428 /DNA_ORIENTATION=-